ncbi:LysR family transcriptional regulator [Actinomadura roseirufa]|uniref:LysR family transcriptional regulator n=1 Tax=Actinomadura roseirufa TaxID=2094049 RepID=UPI0013F14644|nr:LysR family transcriptional regulator [Actinomadura roseirufa]
MMNLRRLRYFSLLARELHFGRTAELLGITQSALSQQIKALEGDIGTDLILRRGARGLELTRAGRALAAEAHAILGRCEHLVARVREIGAGRMGTLSVSFSPSGPLLGQRDFMERFTTRYPGIEISTSLGCTARNVERLLDRDVDVAFVRQVAGPPPVHSLVLSEPELVAVLPPGHRLADAPLIDRGQLRGEPAVLCARHLGAEVYDHVIEQVWGGSGPRAVREEPDHENVFAAVRQHRGVAVLDRPVAEDGERDGIVTRRFAPPVPRAGVCLAWHSDRVDPVVRSLVDLAKEHRHFIRTRKRGRPQRR